MMKANVNEELKKLQSEQKNPHGAHRARLIENQLKELEEKEKAK